MRTGQAMLVQQRWNTHEPVQIHLSKPAWWDTVVHFGYGYRGKFTSISEAWTTWSLKANEMARRRDQLPKHHRCRLNMEMQAGGALTLKTMIARRSSLGITLAATGIRQQHTWSEGLRGGR